MAASHVAWNAPTKVTLWGSMRLICEARLESLWSVSFCLQPHHLAGDFQPLLSAVERSFKKLSARHSCRLMDKLPLIVVDGKWCLQHSLCNDRFSGTIWSADLELGSFVGCGQRPQRGSKYCLRHVPANLPEDAASLPQITSHRETQRCGLSLEFKLADAGWVAADTVPLAAVRQYELSKLPRCSPQEAAESDTTCSRDPRRGNPETRVARKSGGILVAVGPCLHIIDVVPMQSTESLTQVVLFVWAILQNVARLHWVVYDFACGVVQFLNRQSARRPTAVAEKWRRLQSLRWVLDRLHFHGHKCREPGSANYNPDVSPYATGLCEIGQ